MVFIQVACGFVLPPTGARISEAVLVTTRFTLFIAAIFHVNNLCNQGVPFILLKQSFHSLS